MDNQHRRIVGDRDLTEEEINLVNEVKHASDMVGHLVAKIDRQGNADPRWLAIARTDLQKSFMFLVRSITKPETF